MLAARVALFVPRALGNKQTVKLNTGFQRCLMSSERSRLGHAARRRTLKEIASTPAKGEGAFAIGQGAVAGASALGIIGVEISEKCSDTLRHPHVTGFWYSEVP